MLGYAQSKCAHTTKWELSYYYYSKYRYRGPFGLPVYDPTVLIFMPNVVPGILVVSHRYFVLLLFHLGYSAVTLSCDTNVLDNRTIPCVLDNRTITYVLDNRAITSIHATLGEKPFPAQFNKPTQRTSNNNRVLGWSIGYSGNFPCSSTNSISTDCCSSWDTR